MNTSSSSTRSSTWLRVVVPRYLTLLLVTAVAVAILLYALPKAWDFIEDMDLPLKSPLREAFMVFIAFILCYTLLEPLRIPPLMTVISLSYPPLWWSIILSLLAICVIEQWYCDCLLIGKYSWYQTDGISRAWVLLMVATIAVIIRRIQSTLQSSNTAKYRDTNNEGTVLKSKLWIDAGERPISDTKEDLLSRTTISSNIVTYVQSNERSIALLGPVGSGKSSILNLVCESISKSLPNVIVVKSDLWRAKDAKAMPQIVIDDIVRSLDGIVDTTSIRDMSISYARFVAAGPSGYFHKLLDARKRTDSLHQLDQLCSLLEAIDRRLILIIDDLDRVGKTFDISHISRFLWAIREIERCCSVISIDPSRSELDYGKLCDSTEIVPLVPIQMVADTLVELYQHWISAPKGPAPKDIDPNEHRKDQDKFELGRISEMGLQTYLQNETNSTPIRMLATVLSTPRSLKHVLHRIDNAWKELHGEVEIDDLIILSTLRHSAPATYQFIITNIDMARAKSDGLEQGSLDRFKERWNTVLKKEEHVNAVRRLVDLLGIEQLRAPAPNPIADKCPQGVHVEGPPDYLARIASGRVEEGAVRDQLVLRHIEQSRLGNRDIIGKRLVERTTLGDRYRAIWQRFHSPSRKELIEIVDHVIDLLIKEYAPDISPVDPALLVLSRKAWRQSLFDLDLVAEDWLRSRAERSVRKSLSLTCGLLRFAIEIRRGEKKDSSFEAHLTQVVLDVISARVRLPDQLVEALSLQHPYTLSALFAHISTPSKAKNTRLIALIVKCLPSSDPKIILQLAYLVGSGPSSKVSPPDTEPGSTIFDLGVGLDRLRILFGGREADVLQSLSRYSGSDALCKRIADAASEALKSFDKSS